MDQEQLTTRLHELKVSLQDGDDLARALGLIGDALERRIRRIRQGLEYLTEEGTVPDGQRLSDVVDRVGETLDRYEDELEDRRERMESLIEEFQESLGTSASDIEQVERELGTGTDEVTTDPDG